MRVLGDVGDGVDRAGDEEDGREHTPARSEAHEHERHRERHDPGARDSSGAEPLDQRRREGTGEERSQGKRGEGRTERGIAQPEVVADLGIAGDHVGEQRAVREEHRRHGEPRELWLTRGHT